MLLKKSWAVAGYSRHGRGRDVVILGEEDPVIQAQVVVHCLRSTVNAPGYLLGGGQVVHGRLHHASLVAERPARVQQGSGRREYDAEVLMVGLRKLTDRAS